MIDVVLGALTAKDAARPRSRQRSLGPSSVGSCRRQAWLALNGAEPVNEPLRLAAVMGTAIHREIEAALRQADPFGERYELELEVEYDGVVGHVDCLDYGTNTAWDWKTITKRKVASFPSRSQITQVQMYAHMLIASGFQVERVGLLGICRDGSEADVVEWTADVDPQIAEDGFAWIKEVVAMEEAPAPESDPVSFCRLYCQFYGEGSCLGKDTRAADGPRIDGEALTAVLAYLDAKAAYDASSASYEAARGLLEGVAGVTPDGVTVKWSARTTSVVDRDAVKAAMGEVPMRAGAESLVLTVRGPK